jgi:integrase
MLLAHEPDSKSKREVSKDCDCPIVCDGSLANERDRIRRRSLGTNSWQQAKALAVEWLRWGQLMEPIKAVLPEEALLIRDAIERFRKSKGPGGENIDPATLRKYDVLLNDRLLKWCDARGITSIKQVANKTTCEDFVQSWRNLNPTQNRRKSKPTEKLLARTTKVAELGRLRYFFNYCIDSGWINVNAAQKIKVETRGGGEPKYGLNPDEYERVLQAAQEWTDGWGNPGTRKARELQVMVPLLRWSGLRISDAAMLNDTQVARSGGQYIITIERMQKTGVTVRVPVPAFVGGALMALPRKGTRDGKRCWFWTGSGEPDTCVNNWRNDIATLMHRAQKPDAKGNYQQPFHHHASTHSLRHTFACLALAAGATLQQVKEWLGHTSVKPTEKHYGHADRHAQIVLDSAYDSMVATALQQTSPLPAENIVSIRSRRRA